MNPIFLPALAAWTALALVVLGLAIFRKVVSSHEDDFLHVRDDEQRLVAEQGAVAHRLESIDKWGKTLTVVALLTGIVLGGYYVYASWLANNAASNNLKILP